MKNEPVSSTPAPAATAAPEATTPAATAAPTEAATATPAKISTPAHGTARAGAPHIAAPTNSLEGARLSASTGAPDSTSLASYTPAVSYTPPISHATTPQFLPTALRPTTESLP
jgi:hypothetical protein